MTIHVAAATRTVAAIDPQFRDWPDTTAITGMLMFGKMSVGVRKITSGLRIRISSANTTNV
jgi:hypothetical protein